MDSGGAPDVARKPAIKILEVGVVGSLDYKIIEAGRADDLYKWLKDNYTYSGDEVLLGFYVQKKLAIHGHEDRHDADEAEQGRDVRRRGDARRGSSSRRRNSSIR